ncbi:MAG TPA: ribonuclease E/G [Rhizomicrobium sp.]
MLIDSSHPEETRVVILEGQKVEEFDFEAASKRPLKGNIYLAKVTRVEPSLQAAFVEYGGNRQGFLAFSEIHPDYYQIPVADRMALLAEQEAEARRRTEDEFESIETAIAPAPTATVAEVAQTFAEEENFASETEPTEDPRSENPTERVEGSGRAAERAFERTPTADELSSYQSALEDGSDDLLNDATPGSEQIDAAGGSLSSASEAKPSQSTRPPQRWMRKRHYKIQEVIKRRQIILVQVVKEERGTKGAALTTYLSLAGRYCVLMPNTPRGGGISRKITSATDRKRLKAAAQALELPEGMGLIIRTAGENRTKAEIKRDYEYLLRMWDTVRELTLKSNAPACVYEEGDLIKRAIRDLYNKDVAEIVVEGDEGYRNAKDFMRMLMPSHAKNVKQYKEAIPLFHRHHIEAQLDAMFSPTVTLRSGGYVVINQAEALVAIDVNSGRATREHSIEDTAYKTNLEAAEEIARQLRLRDLAGLVVIDFIDMEDGRNDRNVEKRLRDCVKIDRARVQIGKISQFGLLEMSRQRLRAGVIAGSTISCPHCGGQGIVRSVESTALRLLRSLEEEGQRQRASAVIVRAQSDVTIYTLNQKRRELTRIETEYDLVIQFEPREGIVAGTFELDRSGQKAPEDRIKALQPPPPLPEIFPIEENDGSGDLDEDVPEAPHAENDHIQARDAQTSSAEGKRKRRRRRRGREHSSNAPTATEPVSTSAMAIGDNSDDAGELRNNLPEASPTGGSSVASNGVAANEPQGQAGNGAPRKRRRRRRGRRGSREGMSSAGGPLISDESESTPIFERNETSSQALPPLPHADVDPDISHTVPNAPSGPVWSLSHDQKSETAMPAGEIATATFLREGKPAVADSEINPASMDLADVPRRSAPEQPARKGWWQRPFRSRE